MPQHPLIALWLDVANGRQPEVRRAQPPPHLCDRRWRFLCECGYAWRWLGDAVWREGQWAPPRKECLNCHTWIDGRVTPE